MRILTEPLLLPVLISGMIAVACIGALLFRGDRDPGEEISVDLDPWTDF